VNHDQFLQQGRYAGLDLAGLDPQVVWDLYRHMLRLRRCEEALVREYRVAQEIRCPVHFTLGQEAVPASLALLLQPRDFLFSHHRCHGYFLAKHAPMQSLFAELFGRATGANGGLAGSQEISMPSHNFHSGAILSGALAIAAGAALGFQLRGQPEISLAGFGEAATEEGIFWEAISYAAVRKLPLIYVCENNIYSMYSHMAMRQPPIPLHERVASFGVKTRAVFGNDVAAVHRVMCEAVAQTRQGNGPWFLEFFTYRWNAHVGPESDDGFGYRPAEELEYWKSNCPIALLEEKMTAAGWPVLARRQEFLQDTDREIAAALAFARSSPFPEGGDLAALNRNPRSPVAERMLPESTFGEFDQNQAPARLAPY